MPDEPSFFYDAFISYSHKKDVALATRLHRQLTKLGKAWWQRRILRVFRDEASQGATPELWPAIERALQRSRYLVLCASPDSAASPWVQKEIQWWLAQGRREALLIALTGGELAWDDGADDFAWSATTPLPHSLSKAFPAEPRWVDFRELAASTSPADDGGFLNLVADLSSTIRGLPKEDILSEEVAQQRRARHWAWGAAAALATTAIVAVVAGVLAVNEREIAVHQRDQALRAETRVLAGVARGWTSNRDVSSASVLVGLAAMPDPATGIARPYVPLAEQVTFQALQVLQEEFVVGGPDRVRQVAFSAGGRWIAAASGVRTVRLYDAATGREVARLQRGPATSGPDRKGLVAVYHVGFDRTANGRRPAIAYSDGTAAIWDGEPDGKVIRLSGHGDAVLDAQFSPDGKFVVTASADKTVRLWDAATGGEVKRLDTGDRAGIVSFSHDGKLIAVASNGIQLWDVATGTKLQHWQSREASAPCFSPNDRFLAAGIFVDANDAAVVWETATGRETARFKHDDTVKSVAFDPTGRLVLTGSQDNKARLWDAMSGEMVRSFEGHEDWVNTAVFDAGGARIVTSSNDGTARLWDAGTGKTLAVFDTHSDGDSMNDAAISPDGTRVATASDDYTMRVWRATARPAALVVKPGKAGLTGARFSPDGSRFATAAGDGSVVLLQTADGSALAHLAGHEKPVNSVAFRFDGARIVTASDDKTVRLWDSATGKQVLPPLAHPGTVKTAAFSPDGKMVASGGDDRRVRLWDAETGKEIHALPADKAAINVVRFTPDGKSLVSGSDDGVVRLWDVARPDAQVAQLSLEQCAGLLCGINGIAISPDGQSVLILAQDGTATLSDPGLKANTEIVPQQCRSSAIEDLNCEIADGMFSPDGRRFVTTYYDKSVRVWDTRTGTELARLVGHAGDVTSAAFSPDGRLVLSASFDGTARLWRVYRDLGELVDDAKRRVPRCLGRSEIKQVQLDGSTTPQWCRDARKWPYDAGK